MVAFDLLYLNGYDLRKLPLIERKTLLKKLIAKTAIQFSESFEVDGPEMFKHACGIGLEGVVSKVRDSRYSSGRGNDWVKKTCAQRETLTDRRLRARRKTGSTGYISAASRARIWSMPARSITASTSVSAKDLAGATKAADPQDAALRQEDRAPGNLGRAALLAEIEYRAKSAEGKVRHPFFKGIREDL